jgi:hypothetical protein
MRRIEGVKSWPSSRWEGVEDDRENRSWALLLRLAACFAVIMAAMVMPSRLID